jgi:uncharacterized protein YjbJ (UPF0337 family)
MAQEPEVIRQNIEETRGDLTRKIEVLEQEVLGTVKGTTAAVAETVENVKGTVEDTVENVKDSIESTIESVKETFDLRLQTQRHPWAIMGGTVFAGYLLGSLLPSGRSPRRLSAAPREAPLSLPAYASAVSSLPPEPKPVAAPRRSILAGLMEQFAPEIQQIKGVAIGAAAAAVRELIKDKLPEGLRPHVHDMIHNVTHKLGGEDVKGPIFSPTDDAEPEYRRGTDFASRH